LSRDIPYKAALSRGRLPYVQVGDRPETLVILTSGSPDHTVPGGMMLRAFVDGAAAYAARYTTYFVKRKQGLPEGYTTQDMAHDYAAWIGREIGGPCHVIGVSAGGFIAQHLAATHPKLVRKLVIAIAGYRLRGAGRARVVEWREVAARNRLAPLLAKMYTAVSRKHAVQFAGFVGGYVASALLRRHIPDLGDFVVTLDALLDHDGWDVLPRIHAPTLVIGGDEDAFYPVEMFRQMDERIPQSKLIVYRGVGHGLLEFRKKEFDRDVLRFLSSQE
jgi:pimeloyl-ACP methyl ester carboxylesterase